MNVVREINSINEQEAALGISGGKGSWHEAYRRSAWIFVGGLSGKLSEGDVLCVFSQWGEIEDIHLCRDEETGKSKCFAFVKYEDQRSTDLAVDNLNGVKLLGKTLRVDHKLDYNAPKKKGDERTENATAFEPGKAYDGKELANDFNIANGVNIFDRSRGSAESGDVDLKLSKKEKKRIKKEAKRRRKRERKEKEREKSLREFHVSDARNIAREATRALQTSAVCEGRSRLAAARGVCSWRGRLDPTERLQGKKKRRKFARETV